jgi:hypothetical protein
MAVRTVLSDTQTAVTFYSSGVLDVGDLHEFIVDVDMTSSSGGTPTITYAGSGTEGGDPTVKDFYTYSLSYTLTISRLTAFDVPIIIVGPVIGTASVTLSQDVADPPDPPSRSSGAITFIGVLTLPVMAGMPFGDRIQVDLQNDQGITLNFTISIIGK